MSYDAASAEFDRHLAKCPWCVRYLDSYRKTIQLTQALAASDSSSPPPDAPEELVLAILSARGHSS
jgi:anti-sigma factor RsiW